jgi:hypothetical protein
MSLRQGEVIKERMGRVNKILGVQYLEPNNKNVMLNSFQHLSHLLERDPETSSG